MAVERLKFELQRATNIRQIRKCRMASPSTRLIPGAKLCRRSAILKLDCAEFRTSTIVNKEWGYWDNDTPQRFVVSGTYEVPFGKGHRLACSGALEKVFGDWQLNAITTFASGQPVTIGITQDNSGTQSGNRPNCTTPASGFHRSIADWVSPSGYSAPAQFFFGDCRPTPGPRAPGISLVDASLFKNLPAH